MLVGFASAFCVFVVAWVVWRAVAARNTQPCCPMAHIHADALELEGISAFGDVVECCRYCKTRSVYVGAKGSRVELLMFTADEWRELRGKVPTEGFRSAYRVSERARARNRSSRWG